MQATDTIAAIATAPGAGGIGVVRLSGPRAIAIAAQLTGTTLQPRHAHYAAFLDGDGIRIDDGIALAFPTPHSYTGEDVVELQGHGSQILLQQVLQRCLSLGARMARPGEFTERAYLNQKIDLVQAEAVADLIAASSDLAVRAARRSLDGVFSQRVNRLLAALTALRVHIEAAIDFPEEEIDFLADAALLRRLDDVQSEHAMLLTEATRGQRLRDGLHVVILGAPNVGKSSLLNALAGSDRAIVTAIPGTTRDVLRESVQVDGIDITLVDTAGLRDSGDVVEREGMRRARAELAGADLVLAVVDARNPGGEVNALQAILAEELAGKQARILWLHNKADLLDPAALPAEQAGHLWVSARNGMRLDSLRLCLRDAAGAGDGADGAFSARARHVEALRRVGAHLQTARKRLLVEKAGELAAEELRLAQCVLGELTGVTDSDDLLGAIFASFCIGK
ncbi:MAG: tRNA uridine-5-carboxymethylaminomethyl(34) synthesis GTPase MnmE [Lysobacteraceae bacterium]